MGIGKFPYSAFNDQSTALSRSRPTAGVFVARKESGDRQEWPPYFAEPVYGGHFHVLVD
jgi:hypothetical protein